MSALLRDGVNEWLILCRARHAGIDGLCVWWKDDGNGYTHRLVEAGLFTEEKARALAGERDLPVRAADAWNAAASVVVRGKLGIPGEMEVRT